MSAKNVEKNLISTLKYFTFFKYPPSFEEIHKFLSRRIAKKDLQNGLKHLIDQGGIKRSKELGRYTLGEYTKHIKIYKKRREYSLAKIKKTNLFRGLLGLFPQIKLIGLSGSLAMLNAQKDDDVDLFVITSRNRLWTARFLALILASLFVRRRKRHEKHINDKICLNLFFEETALKVPNFKRTVFVAHEVLQMKPTIVRSNIYKRFIEANKWVFKLFPNPPRSIDKFLLRERARSAAHLSSRKNLLSSLGDFIELILKKLQLSLINRHKTSEIITDKQLWFFPEDFEKKLKIR